MADGRSDISFYFSFRRRRHQPLESGIRKEEPRVLLLSACCRLCVVHRKPKIKPALCCDMCMALCRATRHSFHQKIISTTAGSGRTADYRRAPSLPSSCAPLAPPCVFLLVETSSLFLFVLPIRTRGRKHLAALASAPWGC